jgi:hypothetical protein
VSIPIDIPTVLAKMCMRTDELDTSPGPGASGNGPDISDDAEGCGRAEVEVDNVSYNCGF